MCVIFTAAWEEGPFHRCRFDEPTGSDCQRVHATGETSTFCFGEKLRLRQLFQTLCFFSAATRSRQTLQTGIQTYYQHLRSVRPVFILYTSAHFQCDCLTTRLLPFRICFLIRPRIQTVKWICGKCVYQPKSTYWSLSASVLNRCI